MTMSPCPVWNAWKAVVAGREQPVGDVEPFLLVEPLLERHPDRVVVDGGLPEQGHLERRLLRGRGRGADREADGDCRRGRR